MSENLSETQNFEPPSVPTAIPEPTLDAPIPPSTSEQVEVPPQAPEGPTEAESVVSVNNDNGPVSPLEPENLAPEQTQLETENASNEAGGSEEMPPPPITAQIEEVEENKPVSEVPTQPTAQMAGNEPLAEPETKNYQPESRYQTPTETYKNHTHENLTKAQLTIQEKKRKKLEKIIEALNTKGKITNDEVEKLLHVSDATATRYLEQLEKEGKIKQSGRTGQSVSYSRM